MRELQVVRLQRLRTWMNGLSRADRKGYPEYEGRVDSAILNRHMMVCMRGRNCVKQGGTAEILIFVPAGLY